MLSFPNFHLEKCLVIHFHIMTFKRKGMCSDSENLDNNLVFKILIKGLERLGIEDLLKFQYN